MSSRWRPRSRAASSNCTWCDNRYVRKGDLLMVIDPTNYQDRGQSSRGGSAAGAGERAEHRRADRRSAGADQAQPGTAAGAKAALVFAQQQAGRYQKLAKDGWGTVQNAQQYTSQLHQQEAAVQTASGEPQSGAAASRVAESAAPQRRGDARAKPRLSSARRRWISSARAFSPRSTATSRICWRSLATTSMSASMPSRLSTPVHTGSTDILRKPPSLPSAWAIRPK